MDWYHGFKVAECLITRLEPCEVPEEVLNSIRHIFQENRDPEALNFYYEWRHRCLDKRCSVGLCS